MKIKYRILKQSKLKKRHQNLILCYSLAEKNRDLNQAFEKVERLNDAKEKLTNELAVLKKTLNEKDNEIEKYEKLNIDVNHLFFSLFSLKQECERIRFDSEQEVHNTRMQVKEIIVR
jgi:chromosome segregation ATPase